VHGEKAVAMQCSVLQHVAVCCSVLQCVALCCTVFQYYVSVHQEIAIALGCSVLQCVAVCCSATEVCMKKEQDREQAKAHAWGNKKRDQISPTLCLRGEET